MVPYGGFWWRVLAYLIDAVVLNIAASVWGGVIGAGVMFPFGGLGMDEQAVTGTLGLLTLAFSLLSNWLYFAVLESSKLQATLGKLAVGVVVTDLAGERISFLRATGRYFAMFLSGLTLCIGFMMVGWTRRKQGLHDKIAGTLVYKTRNPRQVESPEGVFA